MDATTTLVLGIIGKKQSGKDTLADILCEYAGGRAVKYSLAGPIKDACRDLFLLSEAQLHEGGEKDRPDPRWGGRTPRQLFQWLGTDVFRDQFDCHFWLTHARLVIASLAESYRIIIVPDIRFVNEAAFIRSFPHHALIRVERGKGHTDPPRIDHHISEHDMDNIPPEWIDWTVHNHYAGLDEYRKAVLTLFREWVDGMIPSV